MGDAVDREIKAKGGGNPFAKGGGDKPPTIATGSWVSWTNKKGRVDLVVTNGKVPGVTGEVEGTKSSPAARVVIWEKSGDSYKSSGRKVGVKVASLKRIPPIKKVSGKASAAQLMTMLATHEQRIADGSLPEHAAVSLVAVKSAFDRGVQSWPGRERTTLSADEWALGRVKALLGLAGGQEIKGYRRDNDLLAVTHPANPGYQPEVKAAVEEPAEGRVRLSRDDLEALQRAVLG